MQQCTELTGPNRSIGLIASSTVPCLETKPGIPQNLIGQCRIHSRAVREGNLADLISVLCRPGGHSEGILPDPIPNSAVKAFCVHGTAAQAAGE